MPKSVYIHIPFCKSKCKYCSFVSGMNTDKIPQYILALLTDIDFNYEGEELDTLYLGGGTPSLLKTEFIEKIISKFRFKDNSEITMEINPDDADLNYFKELKSLGINRLSMGSQSFDNKILDQIGRRHSAQDTKNAVKTAKLAGFKNISLDLIYGLANQNISKDLEEILKLDVPHISTYGLKIEEGSFFYNNRPENLPDDDTQADMYLKINEILSKNGYKRYEISNFSKPNYESKHNLTYWNNQEYYGFGLAAHGYKDGIRYSKSQFLKDYLENPQSFDTKHKVTNKERLEEEIFLGFRKEEGINVSKINELYNINFEHKYRKILDKYLSSFVTKTNMGYKLTLMGVLVSNNILADFLE